MQKVGQENSGRAITVMHTLKPTLGRMHVGDNSVTYPWQHVITCCLLHIKVTPWWSPCTPEGHDLELFSTRIHRG
jgi:hypothetical protein